MANQYFTCTLHAWREGTTLYGYMTYARNDGLTYFYQDTELPAPTMDLGGIVYTDTAFKNALASGINVGPGGYNTTTFSRTVSGTGTRTVTWTCGAGLRNDFQGTWSVDVGGFPGTETPPDTPTVSVATNSDHALNITWGTASFGNPSTGTVYLYYGTSASPTAQATNKSTTGNSLLTMDILSPNTKYYYRSRAKNTSDLWSSYSADVTGVTKAAAATVSLTSYDSSSATIYYSASADGGEYNRTLQYSLDGSTWVNAATISDGNAHTGTITITGLTPSTSYTIRTRMTTTAGSSTGANITVTTKAAVALYGSVSGQTKKVAKLYGSLNGETKLIKKLYASVNGVTKKIYEA